MKKSEKIGQLLTFMTLKFSEQNKISKKRLVEKFLNRLKFIMPKNQIDAMFGTKKNKKTVCKNHVEKSWFCVIKRSVLQK